MNLPLPAETREILSDKNKILGASNIGLLFNKYVYCWQTGWQMNEEHIKDFRKNIEESVSKIKLSKDKDYVAALNRRQSTAIESLKDSGWHVELFELTTDTRLIIGLGGTSVIETGMALHPLYGFPYLPASGLKGLARAYAEIGCDASKEGLLEVFGSEDKDTRNAVNNQQGKVFFMDGLPTSFPKLELDIMNPHYGEYYQGDKPPADYLNPVPITFLAVKAGEKFSFAISSRENELANKAKEWLMGGLTELGVGGKTNVGYGYFKSIFSSAETIQQNPQVTTPNPVSHTTIWENASLSWSSGNKTLMATKDNKKAERSIGDDRAIVPEPLRNRLFEKKKTVMANVTVEPVGNSFRIVEVK